LKIKYRIKNTTAPNFYVNGWLCYRHTVGKQKVVSLRH